MTALNDDSLMPFGVHMGKKLKDVPLAYICYCWNRVRDQKELTQYIMSNMKRLKRQHPEGTW